jgi:hypothetical protein
MGVQRQAFDFNTPLARLKPTRLNVTGGPFSGLVRADESEYFSRYQLERDVPHRLYHSIVLSKLLDPAGEIHRFQWFIHCWAIVLRVFASVSSYFLELTEGKSSDECLFPRPRN